MRKKAIPKNFLKLLKNVKAKRPKTVIDHILKHGRVTTEELKEVYGYNHPPRAARDVREHGIPIKTCRIDGPDGKKIAAYELGDPTEVRSAQLSGRTAFSKRLKRKLVEKYGSKCSIYLEEFPEKDLQIDHRVPFEIAGNDSVLSENVAEYMLLCASANRAKSWSCENCSNWESKSIENCRSCYWAHPESYSHIAMQAIRRLDLLWKGEEISTYETLKQAAEKTQEDMPGYVKKVLQKHFKAR